MTVMAYRLLREVRTAGRMHWSELETRVGDTEALEQAVDWLTDRGLVRVDDHGLQLG